MAENAKNERYKISVSGIVQGVGFRPFIYRLAKQHGLSGFVTNTTSGVMIEAEGLATQLDSFLHDIQNTPPPLAKIDSIASESTSLVGEREFTVHASAVHGNVTTLIAPDMAICKDCLAEMFSVTDRRHLYPFINCTNCGPRYTIIDRLPYDRKNTSMHSFTMCGQCQREYDDPADRRFHAQPNACPQCGPEVFLTSRDGEVLARGGEAIAQVRQQLLAGKVIAIKGVGGFHLAVDARNDEAVRLLRERKKREAKPLAVMVRDEVAAQEICHFSGKSLAALNSPQRPIVLARQREGHGLALSVAPFSTMFGIVLPYAPLHYLLFADGLSALVMTSGNMSDEPICKDNDEALQRLNSIADGFLLHDRDILQRCDDSVMMELGGEMRQVRRSRGFAPQPFVVHTDGPQVLGVGGELKNTVCFLKGNQAIVSQHVGDLKNLEAYQFFQECITHLEDVFEASPQLVVHDLHPVYLSSRWAEEQATPRLAVQHHHAHLAACLAENEVKDSAIGLMLDGTGLGTDNKIWGGEVLIGDCLDFERFASLEEMPLPGGDAAVKAPWRTAIAYLHAAFGNDLPTLPFMAEHEYGPIVEMVDKNINTPFTSSCGRLFDAVAAMGGGCQDIRYEAQAAIEFMEAGDQLGEESFAYRFLEDDEVQRLDLRFLIRQIAQQVEDGAGPAKISQRFHATLVEAFTDLACLAREKTRINKVALSGGVFQNRLLFEGLLQSLRKKDFTVLTHTQLPCNDGCVSFGQAVIGRARMMRQGSSHGTTSSHDHFRPHSLL